MGCNVCSYNRDQYIEHEFQYAINNSNIENEEQKNENNQNNSNNQKEGDAAPLFSISGAAGQYDKPIDEINLKNNNNEIKKDTKDKNKNENKIILSNQIIKSSQEVKHEENKDSNNPEPIIKLNEKEDKGINNLKNLNEENNVDSNIIIENKSIKIENIANNIQNNENKKILKNNKLENENEIRTSKNNISVNSGLSNKNDYNTRIVDLINKLRTNPKKYAEVILSNIQYINTRVKIIADDVTGQNEEKAEIFFQKKVKVGLYRGEIAFKETANFLRNLEPRNELIIKEEIKINTLPKTEEEIMNDKSLINNQLNEIAKKNKISAFFKDSVRNPEIGLMLMIIGDYQNSKNKKRNALLNPDYKYIAVNCTFIGDKFVSYFTFSK